MATLEDYTAALRMRDVVKSLAASAVDEKVGKTEYATVQSVNYFTRKCTVQYANGKTAVVNMGSKWPAAVGQTVRLGGTRGDRFVDDVMGAVAVPPNSYFKSRDDVDNGAQMQWDGAGTWRSWQATVFQNYMTFQTVDNTGAVVTSGLKLRDDGAVIVDADSKRDSTSGTSANAPPYSLVFGGSTSSGEIIRSNRITGASNDSVDNKWGLDFITAYTVRFRIYNNGSFFFHVGGTFASGADYNAGNPWWRTCGASGNRGIVIQGAAGMSQKHLDVLNSSGTSIAYVNSSGNVAGTGAYTALSDMSAKTDISYAAKSGALEIVKKLKPARFAYKETPEERHLGFVAQDVQDLIPEAVVEWDDSVSDEEIAEIEKRYEERGEEVYAKMLASLKRKKASAQTKKLGLRMDPVVAHHTLAIQELAERLEKLERA